VIPALLAAPVVQGVVGSIAGSVAGTVSSLFSSPSSAPASSAAFSPYLNRASLESAAVSSTFTSPSGSMTSNDWSQMSPTEVQAWMKSLAGKHVHATDVTGRTISGVVTALTQEGGAPALNVGGHVVSLSQVNQISWSPAIH
jgi:hypothetical protein